jgi:hypothetical protein
MANRYYGLNRGQQQDDVTEGSSTGSTDIEVRVDLSKSFTKGDVVVKLEELRNYVLAHKWPPA